MLSQSLLGPQMTSNIFGFERKTLHWPLNPNYLNNLAEKEKIADLKKIFFHVDFSLFKVIHWTCLRFLWGERPAI